MDAEVFQFTTSHGGRPYVPFMVLYTNCLSIHDLTRRSTVLAVSALAVPLPFNSRPHTEVDSLHLYYSIYTYLSIHDLTRRSPVAHNAIRKCINLSIHDLTRRSTHLQSGCASENQLSIHDLTRRSTCSVRVLIFLPSSFNSRPHTEVDHFPGADPCLQRPFNSRPHTEVDDLMSTGVTFDDPFNSRPHTEVDADAVVLYINGENFQFTTSHGGRLVRLGSLADCTDLSIHDLTRRSTRCVCIICQRNLLSIHDLTRRSTRASKACERVFFSFNSRPHTEVD